MEKKKWISKNEWQRKNANDEVASVVWRNSIVSASGEIGIFMLRQ